MNGYTFNNLPFFKVNGKLACHILLFTFCVLLSACNDPAAPDFLKSNGPQHTEQRSVSSAITHIEVNDDIRIILSPDSGREITLTGPANVLPQVRAEFADGRLTLSNANTFNWVRAAKAIEVRIPAARLEKYVHHGYGDLRCADTLNLYRVRLELYGTANTALLLKADVLSLDANSLGTLTLAGHVRYAYMFTLKTAEIAADNFTAQLADLDIGSRRDARLKVTDSVQAVLRSTGNAVVAGRPRNKSQAMGTGRLVLP